MIDKCSRCPAKDKPFPCLAQVTGHTRYCEFVDPASPLYDPRYVALLALDPDCPDPLPPGPTIPLAETQSLIARMKECPSREASAGCGCNGAAKCRLGKGQDGIVSHQECFVCLRDQRV